MPFGQRAWQLPRASISPDHLREPTPYPKHRWPRARFRQRIRKGGPLSRSDIECGRQNRRKSGRKLRLNRARGLRFPSPPAARAEFLPRLIRQAQAFRRGWTTRHEAVDCLGESRERIRCGSQRRQLRRPADQGIHASATTPHAPIEKCLTGALYNTPVGSRSTAQGGPSRGEMSGL